MDNYYFGPLPAHLDDCDKVLAAGAQLPASWTALRERHAQVSDDSMSLRYVNSVITGEGDRTALRAAAIAEARADSQAEAAIDNVVASAVARELRALYAPQAADVYRHCADRFATAAAKFTKAASVTDVEGDPANLIQASTAQRTAWAEATVLSRDVDIALDALAAAARLAGCAVPLETNDQLIALAVDDAVGTARRKLWEAWQANGRTGRWAAVAAVATIRPTPLEQITAIEPPPPMATRMVRNGIGWRQESYDPLSEPVAAR